jgi:hypothetical protein
VCTPGVVSVGAVGCSRLPACTPGVVSVGAVGCFNALGASMFLTTGTGVGVLSPVDTKGPDCDASRPPVRV